MATIRWLHMADNDPWQVDRRFVEMMKGLGHRVEAFARRDPAEIEQDLQQGVLTADAFVLTNPPDVLITEGVGDRVWKTLASNIKRWSKRLLVIGADQQLNRWLDTFDMQVSSHKLFPPGWDARPGRDGILRVNEQPATVALGGLFSDVEEIRVTSPWLLRCGPRAQPLLVCPPDSDVIDRGDRFLTTDDPSRVCAGYWTPGPEVPPRVFVFSAGCFEDGALDYNLAFARNTIEWLVGHDWSVTVMEMTGRYLADVEMTLRDLIELELRKVADDAWFERIPDEARGEMEGRHRHSGSQLEPFDYATLGDLIAVVRDRWDVYEQVFVPRRKRDLLRQLHRFAAIRNRMSHPPRARKEPPTDAELSWVKELHEFLAGCLQRTHDGSPPASE